MSAGPKPGELKDARHHLVLLLNDLLRILSGTPIAIYGAPMPLPNNTHPKETKP